MKPFFLRFLKIALCGWLLTSLFSATTQAVEFPLPPPGTNIVGQNFAVKASYEDTLMDIAQRYDIGFDEMMAANPNVDRWIPGEGTKVIIPQRFILPDGPRKGIVINLPEKRLYYYGNKKGQRPSVETFPVGIGRQDWATPMGLHKIVSKIKNPTWTPPASIRKEHKEEWGSDLPAVVPAGPDNPLGTRKMGLDVPGYLIHGTGKPDGVGARVSHGCIRMHNADVEKLFGLVSKGEQVRIVNQPIKIGLFANSLFMEAHAPFEEPGLENLATLENAVKLLQEKASGVLLDYTNKQRLQETITRGDGMVLEISKS